MATYDELMRLVSAAAGGDAAASAVAPRPLPQPSPALAPSPMVAPYQTTASPSPDAPALGDALMGPAGPLERLSGVLPGNPAAGLLDIVGTLLRGHSAYGDARRREQLNAIPGVVADQHTKARLAAEEVTREQQNREATLAETKRAHDAAVRKDRIDKMTTALATEVATAKSLQDQRNVATPEEAVGIQQRATASLARIKKLQDAIQRVQAGMEPLAGTDPTTLDYGTAAAKPVVKPEKPEKTEPVLPAGVLSKDQLQAVNAIAGDVRLDPDVKDFVTIRDNFKRMSSMAALDSGQGDLSLIFSYMKVLDPTSVVRETEYQNAAEAIGKAPMLANTPRQWLSGKKLTPEGRLGFMRAATALYNAKLEDFNRASEQYRKRAAAAGVPFELVMRDYRAPSDKAAKGRPNPAARPGGPRVRNKATGQTGTLDSEAEFDPNLYERIP